MKLKLVLCGVTLLLAGCASEQNPFATSGNYSYTYDYVPEPVPDINPIDLDVLYQLPPTGPGVSTSSGLSQTSRVSDYGDR